MSHLIPPGTHFSYLFTYSDRFTLILTTLCVWPAGYLLLFWKHNDTNMIYCYSDIHLEYYENVLLCLLHTTVILYNTFILEQYFVFILLPLSHTWPKDIVTLLSSVWLSVCPSQIDVCNAFWDISDDYLRSMSYLEILPTL